MYESKNGNIYFIRRKFSTISKVLPWIFLRKLTFEVSLFYRKIYGCSVHTLHCHRLIVTKENVDWALIETTNELVFLLLYHYPYPYILVKLAIKSSFQFYNIKERILYSIQCFTLNSPQQLDLMFPVWTSHPHYQFNCVDVTSPHCTGSSVSDLLTITHVSSWRIVSF